MGNAGHIEGVHLILSRLVFANDDPFEDNSSNGADDAGAEASGHDGKDQTTCSRPEVIPVE